MPRTTPKGPGDNAYPRYQRAQMLPTAAQQFTKGSLYQISPTTGLVTDPDKTGNVAEFEHGIVQAAAGTNGISAAAEDRVSCFAPGSRIIVEAGGTLARGMHVEYHTDDNRVHELEDVSITPAGTAAEVAAIAIASVRQRKRDVGRVFDFYGGIPDASVVNDKLLAKATDLVIVELAR